MTTGDYSEDIGRFNIHRSQKACRRRENATNPHARTTNFRIKEGAVREEQRMSTILLSPCLVS